MAAIFSDEDISRLIQERKPLPDDYRTKIEIRPKSGHKERELDIKGADGGDYRLFFDRAFSTLLISQSFWLIDLQNQTSFFVCSDIMEKAMNILTLSKGKHSMIFTFIRRQRSIRRSVPEKIPLPNQRIDLPIFSRPYHVCSRIVVLRCLMIHKADFLRRYKR